MGHSTNISMHGAYIVADCALTIGEVVLVFIEIPKEVSGKPSAEYCFTARIVHFEPIRMDMGKVGIGVKFLCYVFAEESKRRVAD